MANRADAVRWIIGSEEIRHLHVVGTIPGVVPLAAAARNGPGIGFIRSRKIGADFYVAWKPPAVAGVAAEYGPEVLATSGVELLLEGSDKNKWIRISAVADRLLNGAESVVSLSDRFNNGVADDDVTAVQAAEGDIRVFTLAVRNDSSMTLTNVRLWLDPDMSESAELEISINGTVWVAPTSESTALHVADIAPDTERTLYVRRTIGEETGWNAKIVNLLKLAWDGI